MHRDAPLHVLSDKPVEAVCHRREHLLLVSRCGDDKTLAPPDLLDGIGRAGIRYPDRMGHDAGILGHPLQCRDIGERVAVHAGDENGYLLLPLSCRIACHPGIPVHYMAGVLPPHQSMAWTDGLYRKGCKSPYSAQHEAGEAGDDVGIVALRLRPEQRPFALRELVVVDALIGTEGTEGVTGEEDSILLEERHHRVGPMDVRRGIEHQGHSSDVELLAVCYDMHWSGSMWFRTRTSMSSSLRPRRARSSSKEAPDST